MKQLPFALVDAFVPPSALNAPPRFGRGNPAAVVFLQFDHHGDDETLHQIAIEFAQPMTAFLWPLAEQQEGHFSIRYFCSGGEIGLCGHASLASAWAIFERSPHLEQLTFQTREKGNLTVKRIGVDVIEMNLAIDKTLSTVSAADEELAKSAYFAACPALQEANIWAVRRTFVGFMLAVDLPDGTRLADLQIDAQKLKHLEGAMSILTTRAPGEADWDIELRSFVPQVGGDEDPVCGAAQTALAPFWLSQAGFEGKGQASNPIESYQASARSGRLSLVVEGDRLLLRGRAVMVATGTWRL